MIGNIWATRKDEKLAGVKLLIIQPLNMATGKDSNEKPLVAADYIGAGEGERVIYCNGSSARKAADRDFVPIDATVVGIIDDLEIDESLLDRAVVPELDPALSENE